MRIPASIPITRQRRIALAVGVPISALLLGLGGVNTVANIGQGTQPVDLSLGDHMVRVNVGGPMIEVGSGGGDASLTLRAGPAPARLTGTVRYSLIPSDISVSQDPSGTTAGFHCPFTVGYCELTATMSVPAKTNVVISSSGGNVSVSGAVDATVSLRTENGDVHGTGLGTAPLTATSDDGDIRLVFAQPPLNLQVSAGNGDVTIVLPRDGTEYDLDTTSNGGDVHTGGVLNNPAAVHRITARAVNGDVTISEAAPS